jgi:ubiquinone biosynthesis protein COQ9
MTGDADRTAARERLLLATLPHVPFDGWTEAALRAGAGDCDLTAVDLLRFCPGGPGEMVRLFSDWADRQMLAVLAATEAGSARARTHERVAAAVMARLATLAPHREAARRALAFAALPPHAALGLGCLYRTVDAIWYAAGDRAADFSFYTKRALLAGVYAATQVYWLDDRSEGATATKAFLDRRLADVLRLGRLRGQASRLLEGLARPACRPRSRGAARR